MPKPDIQVGSMYYFEDYSFLVFPTKESFEDLVNEHKIQSSTYGSDNLVGRGHIVLGGARAAKLLSEKLQRCIDFIGVRENFMIVNCFENGNEFFIKIIGSHKMGWVNLSYFDDMSCLKHLPKTEI